MFCNLFVIANANIQQEDDAYSIEPMRQTTEVKTLLLNQFDYLGYFMFYNAYRTFKSLFFSSHFFT